MKVIYPGPGGQTYHPKLGKLIADEPFELDDEIAKKYVKSGLLRAKSEEQRAESIEPKAGTQKNKKAKIKEEQSDDKSTNR